MVYSMFQLMVFIKGGYNSRFPTTMSAFMLELDQWFMTVYNYVNADTKC